MIRIDNAPIPNVKSRRKVGVEIEVDPGPRGNRSQLDRSFQGWTKQHDPSVPNGFEFIFDGPVLLGTAQTRIQHFCSELKDVNIHTRGGFHVHVQGIEYTKEDTYWLAFLYTKFQSVIDQLVGPSRNGNYFCKPRSISDFSSLQHFLNLSHMSAWNCTSRGTAKCVSNRYFAVNLNMMACREENHRSIEFRQGSVSKRFGVVFGWVCFLVALTDAAKDHDVVEALPNQGSLQQLVAFLHDYEQRSGSTGVADWVQWRHDYLNQKPDDAELRLALEAIAEKPIGMYGLSRKLDINLVVCKRLLETLTTKGLIFKRAGSTAYHASYEFKAEQDLKTILEAMKSRMIRAASAETSTESQVNQAVGLILTPPPLTVGSV